MQTTYNIDQNRVFISDITNRIYVWERTGTVGYAKTGASSLKFQKGVFKIRPEHPHCDFAMIARPLTSDFKYTPVLASGPIIKSKFQRMRYFTKVSLFEYWIIYHGPAIDFKAYLKNLPSEDILNSHIYFREYGGTNKRKYERKSRNLHDDYKLHFENKKISQNHIECKNYTITAIKVKS